MTKTNQLTPQSQPQTITEQSKLTIPTAQKVSQQQRQAIFHKFIEKYVPHEKHLLRKTKLIKKKKAEAIAFMNLDKNQVAKAVECLKKFDSSQQSHPNLFTEDAFIYLQIDLSRVPQHYSIRPVQISLPHPIYTQAYNSKFTIFTLNPSAQQTQNNNQTQQNKNQTKVDKELLAPEDLSDLNLGQLSQITYEQVKKQYCQNIDKLKLIAANDLFFCDWKLYNLLRLPLGKVFYDKKKYPFPIDCQQVPQELASKYSSYREYIQDLTNYTYFMMGNGPVYSLKIGRISMPVEQLVKNILRGTFRTLPYILGAQLSPSDVRQITIKTHNSPSLPIYSYINPNYAQTYKTYENNPNKPKPQQKPNKKQKPQKKGKISRFYKQKRQQKKEQK